MRKTNLPTDENMNPIPALPIGFGKDVTNSVYDPQTNILSITALLENTRLFCYKRGNTKTGDGELLPLGMKWAYHIYDNYIIEVLGSANISEVIE